MERAGKLVFAGAGDIFDGCGLFQNPLGLLDDLFAKRCGIDPRFGAFEQRGV